MTAQILGNLYFGSLMGVLKLLKNLKNVESNVAVLSILEQQVSFKNILHHKSIYMKDDGTNGRDFIATFALHDAVQWIHDHYQSGMTVIIHCFAGNDVFLFF